MGMQNLLGIWCVQTIFTLKFIRWHGGWSSARHRQRITDSGKILAASGWNGGGNIYIYTVTSVRVHPYSIFLSSLHFVNSFPVIFQFQLQWFIQWRHISHLFISRQVFRTASSIVKGLQKGGLKSIEALTETESNTNDSRGEKKLHLQCYVKRRSTWRTCKRVGLGCMWSHWSDSVNLGVESATSICWEQLVYYINICWYLSISAPLIQFIFIQM